MMAASSMVTRVQDDTTAVAARAEEELAALMLDPEGRIRDCNESAEALLGFHHDELVARPVAFVLPQLRDIEWFQDGSLNARLSFFCHIGLLFSAVRRDGTLFPSQLFFHDVENGKTRNLRLIIRQAKNAA